MNYNELTIDYINPDTNVMEPYSVEYGSPNSACFDIRAAEQRLIYPLETVKVRTGLYLNDSWNQYPNDFHLQIFSRSGLASKGVVVANAPGIVDGDYRQEICVLLTFISYTAGGKKYLPFNIEKGDRIAQAMPVSCSRLNSRVVLNSIRSGGFGSTGV